MIRVAVYARVSTSDKKQDVGLQLKDLNRHVEAREVDGWTVFRTYCDYGVSGAKDRRPQLDALMDDARKKRFHAVLVWRFDRFGRSSKHLLTALDEFKHLGIDFISYQENIDTSSPIGKVFFTMASAFAEFERDILKERVRAGLRNARAKGKTLGRPSAQVDKEELLKLREEGLSIRKIGVRLGVDKMTVYKTLKNPVTVPQ